MYVRLSLRSKAGVSIFISFLLVLGANAAFAYRQTYGNAAQWTASPFEQKVFIENKGQFDETAGVKGNILFQAKSGGIDIYLTGDGITYCYDEIFPVNEKETDAKPPEVKHHTLRMKWLNSNPAVEVIAQEKVSFYYTYSYNPKNQKQGIIANAYRKIIYSNLYPGIDAEYILPEDTTGIKYSLILHPGADLNNVKMKWDGNNISKDSSGNIIIGSSMGTFTDHLPKSCYADGGAIKSAFQIKDNSVSFSLGNYDPAKKIIIDPWVINPNLTAANKAYDVNYDLNGNVYAYGGGSPTKLAKFNSSGALQWIFNASIFFLPNYYGDFTVDANSGTSYIGEPFNVPAARVLKVNSSGVQTGIWSGSNSMNEVWRMDYNYCNGTVLCAGGGTVFPLSQVFVLDTNMSNITPVDVVGAMGCCIDVALLSTDPYSNYCYMLFAQVQAAGPTFDNILVKSPLPSLIPTAWNIHSGHPFMEGMNAAYVASSGGLTNGFNGIAVSPNYVYTYDGKRVKRWNKLNGALADTLVISNTTFSWGGLAVDECNNLLVGFENSIQVYDSAHTLISTIPLPDTVYDLKISGTKLYACGNTFVTQIDLSTTPVIHATLTATPTTCAGCDGTAAVNITTCNSNQNFSYQWSPGGQTTQTATALCAGIYHVTVTNNNSCNIILTDSVMVNPSGSMGGLNIGNDTTICQSTVLQLSSNITAASFLWSTGDTTSSISIALPGTYWLIASSGLCSDTDSVTVTSPQQLELGSNYSLCDREEIILSAGNYPGASYSWSTGESSQSITVNEPGTYWVRVFFDGCLLADTAEVSGEGFSAVYFPNVFTPNGDRKNETFKPVFQNISTFHLTIFNRWGELIFETGDPVDSWDGTYHNKEAPVGVYLYTFSYSSDCGGKKEKTKYGAVTLIR